MRLRILLVTLAIVVILLAGCTRPTEQPLPDEATVIYASDMNTEIYVRSFGTIYGYDWETLELTSQIFFGEGIRMTFSGDRQYLYVISSDKGALSMVNTRTNALEKTIALNTAPVDIIYLPDSNSICVALQPQRAIQVLRADDLGIISTFQLDGFPYRLARSPDGSVIYTNMSSQLDKSPTSLLALDQREGTILGTTELAKGSYELAVPQHGKHIYISKWASGSVTVVDSETLQVARNFEDITKLQFPDSTLDGIAVSPDDDYLYFCDGQSDYIRAIELQEGKLNKEITLKRLSGIFITNSGRYLFAVYQGWFDMHNPSNKTPGSLYVIDIDAWQVIHQFDIVFGSVGVVASPSL